MPAALPIDLLRRSKMAKREASAAAPLFESDAPATMRMALLTNRAKVKREIARSTMEYLRQKRMAAREGRYFSLLAVSSVRSAASSAGLLCASSYSYSRGCTRPLPRYKLWGITVAPRIPVAWSRLLALARCNNNVTDRVTYPSRSISADEGAYPLKSSRRLPTSIKDSSIAKQMTTPRTSAATKNSKMRVPRIDPSGL